MTIGEYIKNHIKEEGRTTKWISEMLGINYKTFVGKLNRNTLSADELFKISVLVDINLEHMKFDLEYPALLNNTRKFIYISADNDEEVLNKERISVVKMEIREDKKVSSEDQSIVYAFVEVSSEDGSKEYIVEEISGQNLKRVEDATTAFMLKKPETNGTYLLRKRIGGNVIDGMPRKKSEPGTF